MKSKYTLDLCRMDCLMQLQLEECHCFMPVGREYLQESVFDNATYCDNEQVTLLLQ